MSGKQGRGGEGFWAGGSRPPTPTPAYFVLDLAEGSAWARGTSGTGFSGSVTGKKGNRKDAWGEDEKGCRPPPHLPMVGKEAHLEEGNGPHRQLPCYPLKG